VVAPDGRPVVAFRAPDSSTLGIRQFVFESPEPRDAASLKAAYPEGVYAFSGKTSSGGTLVGKSTLSHRLRRHRFRQAGRGGGERAGEDLAITWSPVEGVASYVVNIKRSDSNASITARLPGTSTSFAVPHVLLSPGSKYTVEIGTVSHEGNMSTVEASFVTEQ